MATAETPNNNEGGVRRIIRNASYLMGSQIATWTMTMASLYFISRRLGPSGFGEVGIAESIWLIAAAFSLFGLDTHLTKTIARSPDRVSRYFGTGVVNIFINFTLTFGGVMLFGWISGYSPLRMQLIAIMGFGSLAYSIINYSQAILTGLERLDYVSALATINRAIYTVLIIAVLLLGGNIYHFAFATVSTSIIAAILVVSGLYRATSIKFTYDFALAKQLYIEGSPYFLTLIFMRLYKEFDMVIMGWLITDPVELGWYAAADRFFATLMFMPNMLMAALFPVLSRLHGEGSDLLPTYVNKSFNILFLIGIPIGLGISAVAEPLIVYFYGEPYTEAAKILSVLGIVLIITYQTILIGYFVISIDKQKLWTITMAIAALATIPLDFVLVPFAATFGPAGVGGALAYIITEGGMVIAGLYFLPKGYINSTNFVFFVKAILAGLIMYGTVLWVSRYGFIPSLAVGGVVYPALILLFRTIPAEDMALIQSMASPITNRFKRFN